MERLSLKLSDSTPSQDPGAAERLLWFVRGLVLVLLILHLLAPLLPEELAWGVWPYAYLSRPMRLILALGAGLTCWPVVNRRIRQELAALTGWLRRVGLAHQFVKFLPLLALPLFYAFRIVHTRWGDAYILTNAIPDRDVHLTYSWQAPLDVYLHARFWQLGHALWDWRDAAPTYAILSVLAGGIFLWVLSRLVRLLSDDPVEQVVAFILFATLGNMQLFFGYIENYTLVTVLILTYLWLGLRCLKGQITPWAPALALAVANATHPSTIVLGPSLLYLGWIWGQRQGTWRDWRRLALVAIQVIGPILLVGGLTFLLMSLAGHGLGALSGNDRPGGGDGKWFVPLLQISDRWEHYTLFSLGHLTDMLNEQLLTAPTILPLGLFLWTLARRSSLWRDREIRFAGVAAAFFLLLTWTWNPDYGGQRDWDLFSLAAIPLTLWVTLVLLRAVRQRQCLAEAGVMLGAVSLLHTAAWIYQNTLPWNWS